MLCVAEPGTIFFCFWPISGLSLSSGPLNALLVYRAVGWREEVGASALVLQLVKEDHIVFILSGTEIPQLAPGEPVPPGFEDVVKRVAQIQETLDRFRTGPLIGLEYIVEIAPEEVGREPMYVCMMCDKKGDPRVVMAHLNSFNHCSKYILAINSVLKGGSPNLYKALPRAIRGKNIGCHK
uniref:Uncharacterized protein n=1 Tax=Timema cristinae TaxID=61476 RepID=A0A7R9CH55_TIMCR|nr:unnamed protein product [Timema cristinae]